MKTQDPSPKDFLPPRPPAQKKILAQPMRDASGRYLCMICGEAMVEERHCKVICKNCGYTMDCSDLF